MINKLISARRCTLSSWNKATKLWLLAGAIFVIIGIASFTFADAGDVSQAQAMTEQLISWNNFLQVLSSIAYIILWPLIALAGLLMDNQLIYGSFMHLDTSLWNIRQIVRTFANYTLGFLFLIGILMYNLSPNGKIWFLGVIKGIDKPQDLIKKTLVASVLIQASWFILMAAVDLSTILTYTVGAIPTSIVGSNDLAEIEDSRILGMNTFLNLWDEGIQKDKTTDEAIVTYWNTKKGNTEKYIAPCWTTEVGSKQEGQSFVIGRKFDALSGATMLPGYCVHYGSLISFAEFDQKDVSNQSFFQKMQAFESAVKWSSEGERKTLTDAGMIYPLTPWKITAWSGMVERAVFVWSNTYNSHPNSDCKIFWPVSPKKNSGAGEEEQYSCLYNETELSISNIINKGESMTGPFTALYSNMLNFSNLTAGNLGVWQNFIVALINAWFAVLLVLPMVALVVVLFARIGILRLAIALSPFIVLILVFEKVFPKDILPKYIAVDELIKLLVAPVLISFAVSLSLVFMTSLKSTLEDDKATTTIKEISGMDVDGSWNVSVLGFIKIKFDNALINFSWFLTMILGLGITWFLLFWAIKQTAIGKSIGSTLQKFWEKTLGTLSIIPIGEKGIGFNAAINAPEQILGTTVNKLETDQRDTIAALFDDDKKKERESDKKIQEFFTSQNGSAEQYFNINYANVDESLDTFARVESTRKSHFQNTAGSLDKMKTFANSLWTTQLEKAKNATWDPELAWTDANIAKTTLEQILGNTNIKEIWTINQRQNTDIQIGNKTYTIKEEKSNYTLQAKS